MYKYKRYLLILMALVILLAYPSQSFAKGVNEINEVLKNVNGRIKTVINILAAFGLATSVLLLIIIFVQLGNPNMPHPARRADVINKLGVVLVTTALMSSVWLVGSLITSIF